MHKGTEQIKSSYFTRLLWLLHTLHVQHVKEFRSLFATKWKYTTINFKNLFCREV